MGKYIFGLMVAAVVFGVGNVHAQLVPPVVVHEGQVGTGDEMGYLVLNQSNLTPHPFDVQMLVVSTTGTNPMTTQPGWTAEALDQSLWDEPMGGIGSTLPTWHQFTGMPWMYPPNPTIHANGYFANYTYDALNGMVDYPPEPVIPPLADMFVGGFLFQGPVGSTFLAAGPTDGTLSIPLGNVQSFSGTTQVPEPSTFALGFMALCGLAGWWWRHA